MATHTATHIAGTGGTYYAFPVSQSLGDWATYRIALAEASSPNLGRYQGTIDDANGSEWLVFSGASQPAGAYAAVGTISTLDATAATEIGKVKRSASAVAAGAAVTETRTTVSDSTSELVETVEVT